MASGQQISYSATLPIKRTVADRIVMIDPLSMVAVATLGLTNEGKFNLVNTPGKMYEWLEDTYSGRSDSLNSAALTSDTTLTTVTVTDGTLFQIGDVILVDAEYMWVSAVSSNDLTVTRAYGGTQATHSSDATISIVGSNRLEGAAASDGHWTQPTTGYNYSAILQKTIEISRTDALLPRYGIPNLVDREINKVLEELMNKLNLMFYHGQRKAGSSSTPRGFGGLLQMISTNATAMSSAGLQRSTIEASMQSAWNNGGAPDVILTGAWGKRKISAFYEGSVRTDRAESMGGISIDRILTGLGQEVSVVVDRNCPAGDMFLLDRNFVGGLTIDPFFEEPLGKSKDTAYYGQVVGEYGFVLEHEKAHAKITGFSTSV